MLSGFFNGWPTICSPQKKGRKIVYKISKNGCVAFFWGVIMTRQFNCFLSFFFAFIFVSDGFAQGVLLNKTVVASNTHWTTSAASVTDGDLGSVWNSGDHAPQWVSIYFLDSSPPIVKLRLIPEQSPNGYTEHIISAQGLDGVWRRVEKVDGVTESGRPFDVLLKEPLSGISILKIETVKSPSWVAWREIQAFSAADISNENTRRLEEERKRREEEARWKRLLNAGSAQEMYLAAGKYARGGDSFKAQQLYEAILNRFSSSNFAVKASDQLLAMTRGEQFEANRRAEQEYTESQQRQQRSRDRDACMSRQASCRSSCGSVYGSGWSRCQDRCSSICSY